MSRRAGTANPSPIFRSAHLFTLLSLAVLGACASPGPPRPPSLNLPEVVSTLTAERVGERVQLHWTTPGTTTDDLDVRGPMNAVLCRRPVTPPEQVCAAVVRLPVVAGPSGAVDQLPSTLITGPTAAIEYRLTILNAKGRSAGESNAAFAVAGIAPPPVQRLRVVASQEGAVLTWSGTAAKGEDAQDAVELHRIANSPNKPVGQPAFGVRTASTDFALRVPPGEGALDRAAEMSQSYAYTARRVRAVDVDGHRLELRGDISPPVTVDMRDTFPPRRPTGLEAVAADRVVDLSWEPNTEPDLAGYIVQRGENALAKLLNTIPVPQPSFQDKTAVPGHTYQYSIVAVDRAGNRSPGSELVPVSVSSDLP